MLQYNVGTIPQYQKTGNRQGVERAQLVLRNQPPLPGATVVRLIQPKDVTCEGALVSISHYYEEEPEIIPSSVQMLTSILTNSSIVIREGSYQMDHNTLWFIANGGAR